MAFPAGITLQPIQVGAALTVLGDGARLIVRIVPKLDGQPVYLTHQATGTAIVPLVEKLTVEGGERTFQVPASDQDGFTGADGRPVSDWYYEITVQPFRIEPWDGVLGLPPGVGRLAELPPRTYRVQPLSGAALIDLDELPVDGAVRQPAAPLYVQPAMPTAPRPFYWLDSDSADQDLYYVSEDAA